MTARLDGVDFAGLASNQGRAALLLTPDITATGTTLVYGSVDAQRVATPFARSDRLAAGSANANSTIAITGTGARYLKLTRTGNTYIAARVARRRRHLRERRDPHVHAGLPETRVRGLHDQLEQQHRELRRRRSAMCRSAIPRATLLIGTERVHGRDRRADTEAGGDHRPRPPVAVASRGPVARRHSGRTGARSATCSATTSKALRPAAVTGGGNIPDSGRALSQGDHRHRARGRAAATRRRRARIP